MSSRFYRDTELLELLPTTPELWDELLHAGTPLRDPTSNDVTFLIAAQAESMHLWINRLSDKQRHHHGIMHKVPGKPWWVLTLGIPPALVASYCFRPNAQMHRPPGHNNYPFLRDCHNTKQLIIVGKLGLSLLLGSQADIHPAWQHIDFARPQRSHSTEILGHEITLYLPAVPFTDLPVVMLFDGDLFFHRLKLEQALDSAIAAGHLPPLAVIGIGFSDSAHRRASLCDNLDFQHRLHEVFYPHALAVAHDRGYSLSTNIILAGYSLGGLAALSSGLHHPQRYQSIISASPSLWWHPTMDVTPADRATQITPWFIAQVQATVADFPFAFVDVGIREDESVPQAHYLSSAMSQQQWQHDLKFHDGGHDLAWWRESLIDRLAEALTQLPAASIKEPS